MAVLSSVFYIKNEIYLDQSYLKHNFKISEQSIQTLINKYKSNSELVKQNPKTKRKFIFSYSLIIKEFSDNFKIPPKYKLLNKLKKAKKEFSKRKKVTDKYEIENYLKYILSYHYRDWRIERKRYSFGLVKHELVQEYCKNHRLLVGVLKLRDEGKSIKDIFMVYRNYRDLIFNPKCYQSFVYKLNKIKNEDDIADNLLHKLRNRISNNHKLKDDVIVEILKLFLEPKKLNASHILEDVNNYLVRQNRQPISLSSVERVIASRYIQNEFMLSRHGKSYTHNSLYPRCFFEDPETNGVLWAVDGTRLQFMYLDNENNTCYLSYVVVIDGFSKKIIGYSFGNYENTEMIVEAVKMACDNTQYFPTEIVHDNSTAFNSEKMKDLIAYSKLEGVNWRAIKVGNPGDNGYVERYFGVFQESMCKRCNGYIGDGITSRNINGKPSKEEFKKFSLKKNIRTLDQLKKEISTLIESYNNRKKRNGVSPNILSVQKESNLVIKLNPILYVKLFWLKTERTVRSSCIIISYLTKSYSYNIYDVENILKLNGVKVSVRFNPKDFKKILIFDIKNGDYITTLDQFVKIPKALVERRKSDEIRVMKHSYKLKVIQKHLESRIEEICNKSKRNNENLPPEISILTFAGKKEETIASDELNKKRIESLVNPKLHKKNKKVKGKMRFENLYKQKATLKIVS